MRSCLFPPDRVVLVMHRLAMYFFHALPVEKIHRSHLSRHALGLVLGVESAASVIEAEAG